MKAEPIFFKWHVQPAGYQWIPTNRGAGAEADGSPSPPVPDVTLVLAEAYRVNMLGVRRRRYDPFKKHTGLFRTFADTPTTPEGMKAFADRFGSLTRKPHRAAGKYGLQPGVEHTTEVGESEAIWTENIEVMRTAVGLWDLVARRDEAEISRRVVWRTGKTAVDYHPAGVDKPAESPADADTVTLAYVDRNEEVADRLSAGDPLGAAAAYVRLTIDERIAGRSSTRLLPDRRGRRVALHHAPRDLLGAMWLQFAVTVIRNKSYRVCKVCGRWFEIPSGVERANKQFCENNCRTRAYRERQSRARQLAAEGKDVAQIAVELGSDVEAVKGWVSGT